jgi:predicted secreted protein
MLRHFVLATLLLLSFAAYAEAEPYNRVDFQVEAARDISNDLLTTRMSLEIQDKQPSQVAQRMNTAFNQALQKAASFNAVKTRSGTQNTYPIYGKNNQIEAWRGHGELHIESRDFKAAGELIMQLQNTLQLNDVQFGIAPDTRTSLETALINEAIKAFQNRAEAIRAAMGATRYKTVHFSINTGGLPPRYQVAVMRSTMVASVPVAEPEFASGETHMTVQINATIELQ